MRYTSWNGSRSRAFTLIELLVVVAVVGILAALLIPSIMSARTQARLTQCRSNMRICTMAVIAYTG